MVVYHSFYENVKQQQLFFNIEIFQPISILEWFMKTKEMAAENSNLHHRNNLNICNYIWPVVHICPNLFKTNSHY